MIKVEDLKDMGYVEDQLDFFNYWEPTKDERAKTPLDMVKEYAEMSEQEPNADLYLKLINEEFKEWIKEINGGVSELKELADLVYVIYGYANAEGWDLDMALLRVHDNNMERMYQDDGTILRREDGKIIKNPHTPKVELKDLIKEKN